LGDDFSVPGRCPSLVYHAPSALRNIIVISKYNA